MTGKEYLLAFLLGISVGVILVCLVYWLVVFFGGPV